MDEREERKEELRRALGSGKKNRWDPRRRGNWAFKKRNWGFWVLVVGAALYIITFYIVIPLLGG